ncbi:MAG: hypothetical protein ACOVT5_08470 [Armatimonadaceae bacterium]
MATQSPAVKHHFWILFFATPVFIGLAFLLMVLMVSGGISAAQKELDDSKKSLTAPPKSKAELKAVADQLDEQEGNRKTLWNRSYEEQQAAGVFAWPDSRRATFNILAKRNMKFGEKFNLQGRVTDPEVLRPTFEAAYTQLAVGDGDPNGKRKGIAPTRFAGGSYLTALRVVTTWGTKQLDPEPFWLALEDYWVQRGLLAPIAQVNADAATFKDVTPKDAKDAELKRNFATRTWELDLEVEQKGPKQYLKGQLRNRTPRLQPLGVNKAMKVQVWLSEPRDLTELKKSTDEEDKKKVAQYVWPAADVVYEIRGESVPGKGVLACSPQEFFTTTVVKIARVVQVFDEATVPVRLVNTIELGMLDHRNKAATLEAPTHLEGYEYPLDGLAAPGGMPLGAAPGGPPRGGPGEGEGEGGPGAGAAVSLGRKTGDPKSVLFDNRVRYVKRTADVRRMPAAVSVVIDNDYTNDLMVAYTNSPLHFQITQTQWARYKATLPGVGGTGTGTGTSGPPGGFGPGVGSPEGPGEGEGNPRGEGPSGPPGVAGPGAFGPGAFGPGSFGPGTTTGGSGALPGEANANLCEFALFGVVSLYEQVPPEEKKKPDENADPNNTGPVTDPMKPVDDKKPGDPSKPADDKKDKPPVTPPADDKKDKPAEEKKDK